MQFSVFNENMSPFEIVQKLRQKFPKSIEIAIESELKINLMKQILFSSNSQFVDFFILLSNRISVLPPFWPERAKGIANLVVAFEQIAIVGKTPAVVLRELAEKFETLHIEIIFQNVNKGEGTQLIRHCVTLGELAHFETISSSPYAPAETAMRAVQFIQNLSSFVDGFQRVFANTKSAPQIFDHLMSHFPEMMILYRKPIDGRRYSTCLDVANIFHLTGRGASAANALLEAMKKIQKEIRVARNMLKPNMISNMPKPTKSSKPNPTKSVGIAKPIPLIPMAPVWQAGSPQVNPESMQNLFHHFKIGKFNLRKKRVLFKSCFRFFS